MALESATYVSQLNISNPGSSDEVAQGDDHLRLIKTALQNTFPDASKAQYFGTMQDLQTASLSISAPTDAESTFPFNCAAAAYTANLPTSGMFDGFAVRILKADFGPNAVTISAGSKTVNGLSTILLEKGYQSAYVIYSTVLDAWLAQVDHITPTGTFLDNGAATAPAGYVACDGTTTIGDGSSGAVLAAITTEALFVHLWNSYSNTVCPVASGRGLSAAADWTADKKITMPDLRGRSRFGRDNLGGTAASRIATGTAVGNSGGTETVSVGQANLPNVAFSGSAASAGDHTHFIWADDTNHNASTGGATVIDATHSAQRAAGGGGDFSYGTVNSDTGVATLGKTSSNGAHTHNVSVASGGSGTAIASLNPYFIVNVFMAL